MTHELTHCRRKTRMAATILAALLPGALYAQSSFNTGGAASSNAYVTSKYVGGAGGLKMKGELIQKFVPGGSPPATAKVGSARLTNGHITGPVLHAPSGLSAVAGVLHVSSEAPTKAVLYATTRPLQDGGAPKRIGLSQGNELVRLVGANLLGPKGSVHPNATEILFENQPALITSITNSSELVVRTPPGVDINGNPLGPVPIKFVYSGTTPPLQSQYANGFIYGPYITNLADERGLPSVAMAFPDDALVHLLVGCCCASTQTPGISGTLKIPFPPTVAFPGSLSFEGNHVDFAILSPGLPASCTTPTILCSSVPTNPPWPANPNGATCREYFFQAIVYSRAPAGGSNTKQYSNTAKFYFKQ